MASKDTERHEERADLATTWFNATRPRRFDGSHLIDAVPLLRAASTPAGFGVAHMQSGNTGLFHVMDAGRTA